jgi:uncharacterized protein with HEPN domain
MKDDKLYLIHICECIERIQEYTSAGKDHFMGDLKTQDAVLRNLQTLGDSVKNISDALKSNYPKIEWKRIAGFRDILVHDYMGVNLDRVWTVVESHLPALKQSIEAIQQSLD